MEIMRKISEEIIEIGIDKTVILKVIRKTNNPNKFEDKDFFVKLLIPLLDQ